MTSKLTVGDFGLIVAECKRHGLLRNQAAYLLATAYHETDATLKPITEYGGRSYFNKYEPRTRIGRTLGNTKTGDGYRFRGRGYVQITGRMNYERASQKIGVDAIGNPDVMLRPDAAAAALVWGCKEGWFTGKRLSDYITLSRSDFVNARRVINGTDRATLIAGYAVAYDNLLREMGYGVDKPVVVKPELREPQVSPKTPPMVALGLAIVVGVTLLAGLARTIWRKLTRRKKAK